MKKKYLDTNVFLYPILYDDNKAKKCAEILSKIIKGELIAFTSILTWDEFVFTISKYLGKEIASQEGRKFLRMPNLKFVKTDKESILKAQELLERYQLKPRDSIHASSAILSNCEEILSEDSDFDQIKEIKRSFPN